MELGRTDVGGRMLRKRKPVQGCSKAEYLMENLQKQQSDAVGVRKVLRSMLKACGDEFVGRELVASGLLAVLPSLLGELNLRVAALAVELLGVLSLSSSEMHLIIVNHDEIMKMLVQLLAGTDKGLLTATCHAVNDLAVTGAARKALIERNVLEHLIRILCCSAVSNIPKENCTEEGTHLHKEKMTETCSAQSQNKAEISSNAACLPDNIVSLQAANCAKKYLKWDGVPMESCEERAELFNVALTAVNVLLSNLSSNPLPEDEGFCTLLTLQAIWKATKIHQDLQSENSSASTADLASGEHEYRLLTGCIVQLALHHELFDCYSTFTGNGIWFNDRTLTFWQFLENFWEKRPVLLSKSIPSVLLAFVSSFDSPEHFLSELLTCSTGCPPACADPIDPHTLVKELENHLGKPLVYEQDIRLVKSGVAEQSEQAEHVSVGLNLQTETELHFYRETVSCDKEFPKYVKLQDCVSAYEKGYTVAIKGMQFRHPGIAAMSFSLARKFGQASVGANLYLTPPNAQGLSLHFDDHCVLVCQLVGKKSWQIYPPEQVLPRLYTSQKSSPSKKHSLLLMPYDLDQGNVLYIPRGFPHKAHTGHNWDARWCSWIHSGEGSPSLDVAGALIGVKTTCFQDFACQNLRSNSDVGTSGGGTREDQHFSQSLPDHNYQTPNISAENVQLRDSVNKSFSLHMTFSIEVESPFEHLGSLTEAVIQLKQDPFFLY